MLTLGAIFFRQILAKTHSYGGGRNYSRYPGTKEIVRSLIRIFKRYRIMPETRSICSSMPLHNVRYSEIYTPCQTCECNPCFSPSSYSHSMATSFVR